MGKIDFNYELFYSLYNQKLTDREIAEHMGLLRRFITQKRNLKCLQPNNPKLVIINHDLFMSYYNEGKSFAEIARLFKCSSDCIKKHAKKRGLINHYNEKVSKNIEIFNEMYKKGMNDAEIAKELNVTSGATASLRNLRKLKSNFSYNSFRKVDYDEVKKLVLLKKGDAEIASILGCSVDTIYGIRMKEGLLRESYAINKSIPLSKYQIEVLIGTVLGDSSLTFTGVSTALVCTHSLKQEELILHKMQIFSSLFPKIHYAKRFDKRKNRYNYLCSFRTKGVPDITPYYDLFYGKGKKVIPKKLLKNFSAVSLAFMFMDDGCKTSCGYSIATDCFTKEDINYLRKILLKRFNLYTTIQGGRSLYIRAKSRDAFTLLVEPHIIDCVKYKLHSVLKKSDKLLGNPEEDNQQPI